MKCIKRYIDNFNDELDDAKKYINQSLSAKVEGKTAEFDLAIKLAPEEMTHAMYWYNLAADKVAKLKESTQDSKIVACMTALWEEAQEDYVECMAKLRYELEQAKK